MTSCNRGVINWFPNLGLGLQIRILLNFTFVNRYFDQIVKPTFLVRRRISLRLNVLISVFKSMIYIKFILICILIQASNLISLAIVK
jgi:hypothetical protein